MNIDNDYDNVKFNKFIETIREIAKLAETYIDEATIKSLIEMLTDPSHSDTYTNLLSEIRKNIIKSKTYADCVKYRNQLSSRTTKTQVRHMLNLYQRFVGVSFKRIIAETIVCVKEALPANTDSPITVSVNAFLNRALVLLCN